MVTIRLVTMATIVGLSGVVGSEAAYGETYYVAPSGSDRGKGTADAPWQTLLHAVNQLAPGDTLIVRPGSYESFYMRRRNSGTARAPIRILAEDGAIVDRMMPRAQDAIKIEYASYIDIEGFRVTGAPRAGIAAVECQGVRIRNNKSYDNGRWGVFTGFCDDLLVENNELSGSKREHGVYVSNSSKNPIVRGNRIWGNGMNGIHTNGDASMGRDGMTVNALIENNIIYNNGTRGGAAINNDGIRDSIIRNNVIYDNYANGITLYRIDGKHPSTNNKVIHNTIIMPRGVKSSRWCIRIVDGSTGNTFKNNICINGHHYRGGIDISQDSLPGFVSDHNILDERFTVADGDSVIKLAEWRALTGQDKSSVALTHDDLDTLFMAAATGDFRLKRGAAAIDRGDSAIALELDHAGVRRSRPDMGALEYCEAKTCMPAAALVEPEITHGGAGEAGEAAPQAGAGEPASPAAAPPTAAAEEGASGAAVADSPPRPRPVSGAGCCKGQIHPGSAGGMVVIGLLVLLVLLVVRRRRV